MNKKAVLHENPEFAAVDAAMKRAAKAAHSLARKTKDPLLYLGRWNHR